ncbi:hypothetical protein GcC1_091022 [Golovinomyces cichoracearum]|uniref:Uncharacterized protein n=1 Tax=Golovinomyces cichoracearum TaxID=62708 RepID=A0A420IFC1_9PEZI|nr:hypothetical protein GcC1_091022 [Golovinomyces cichoracearum]
MLAQIVDDIAWWTRLDEIEHRVIPCCCGISQTLNISKLDDGYSNYATTFRANLKHNSLG